MFLSISVTLLLIEKLCSPPLVQDELSRAQSARFRHKRRPNLVGAGHGNSMLNKNLCALGGAQTARRAIKKLKIKN